MATHPTFAGPGYQFDARPDLRDLKTRERLSQSAMDGFFAITEKWHVPAMEQCELLGGISRAQLHKLKTAAGLRGPDELTRISLIVGIYKALHILLPAQYADEWMNRPNDNTMFSGNPPLEFALRNGILGLQQIRSLLDAARGGVQVAYDARFDHDAAHRLIPSIYSRGGSVLETLELPPAVLHDLSELDGATNERKFAESGGNAAIGIAELLANVPEAHIVNAAYCHPGTDGARFSDNRRGAWYAGIELRTSFREVAVHKQRFLRESRIAERAEYEYQDFLADFHGIFSHLDEAEKGTCLQAEVIPHCYAPGQALARQLLSAGKAGIVYPSVRDSPDGMCIACFRPALVNSPRRGARYILSIDACVPWDESQAREVVVVTDPSTPDA